MLSTSRYRVWSVVLILIVSVVISVSGSAARTDAPRQLSEQTAENPSVAAASNNKNSRSGFGIQKTPPDLQFGLAFTVPFVSLSTEKLLGTIAGKQSGLNGWSGDGLVPDVSSLLKLNVGGLVLAVVIGIAALVFVPSIFPGRHNFPDLFPPGFFPGIIDTVFPGHHNKYGNSGGNYGSSANYGGNYYNGPDYRADRDPASRNSRFLGNATEDKSIYTTVKSLISDNWQELDSCRKYALCIHQQMKSKSNETLWDTIVDTIDQFQPPDSNKTQQPPANTDCRSLYKSKCRVNPLELRQFVNRISEKIL